MALGAVGGRESLRQLSAKIEHVRWSGLRCRVTTGGDFAGCLVDLRDKAADPGIFIDRGEARRFGRKRGSGRPGRQPRGEQ